MKDQDFKLIGCFLPDSLKEMGIEKKLEETRVVQAWESLFGNTMEKFIEKVYVKNRVLYIEVTSSLLKQNLLYQKELFIAKINQHIGLNVLDDIHFF